MSLNPDWISVSSTGGLKASSLNVSGEGKLEKLVTVPGDSVHQVFQKDTVDKFNIELTGSGDDFTINRFTGSGPNIVKTQALTISSETGNVDLGTSGTTSINNLLVSGSVGIGTATPTNTLHVEGSIRSNGVNIESQGVGSNSLTFTQNQSPDNIAELGYINFNGRTPNATSRRGALILSRSEQTWTDSSCPAFLTFSTTPSGQISEVPRMTILGNGNVGIGTVSPGTQLVVQQVSDGNVGANGITLRGANGTSFGLSYQGGVGLSIVQNLSLTPVTFREGGNVGIGTTNPTSKLHLYGGASGNAIRFQGAQDGHKIDIFNNSGVNANYGLQISRVNDTNNGSIRFYELGNSTDNIPHIWYDLTGQEKMRMNAAGNVGIGTENPGANRLYINGTSAFSNEVITPDRPIENVISSTSNLKNLSQIRTVQGGIGEMYIGSYYTGGSTGGYIQTNDAFLEETVIGSNLLLNPAGGNVGIGTASPLASLHVERRNPLHTNDYSNFRALLTPNTASGTAVASMRLGWYTNTFDISAVRGGGADILRTDFVFGSDPRMSLTSAGNLGIGTTNPGDIKLNLLSVLNDYATKIESINEGGSASGLMIKTNGGGRSLFVDNNGYGDIAVFEKGGIRALTINSARNVGIGTANPGAFRLLVSGDSSFSSVTTNNGPLSFDGIAAHQFFRTSAGSNRFGVGLYGQETGSNDGSNFSIASYNDAGSFVSSRLVIRRSDGNVGIGTANPGAILEIAGGLKPADGFSIINSSDSKILFYGSGNSTGNWAGMGVDAGGNWWLRNGTATQNIMYMRSTTGNVGIGTTDPGAKLHVDQNILISGTSERGLFFRPGFVADEKYNMSILADPVIENGDGLSINAFGGINFSTGSNTRNSRMIINSAGNVGIGTATPESKLNIVPDSNHLSGWFKTLKVCGPSDISSMIEGNNTAIGLHGDNKALYFMVNGTGDDFRSESWLSSVKMIINQSGNVGIGTVTPSSRLHINNLSVSNSTVLRIGVPNLGSTSPIRHSITYGNDALLNDEPARINFIRTNSSQNNNTDISFDTFNGQAPNSSGSEKMRITSVGNVGIGNSNPTHLLQVHQDKFGVASTDSSYSILATKDGGSDDNTRIVLSGVNRTNFGGGIEYITANSGGNNNHRFINGSNERMRITSAGNVGIGTAAPSTQLVVQQASDGDVGANGITLRGLGGKDFSMTYVAGQGLQILENRASTIMTFREEVGGSVGIGILPAEKLHVNGNVLANNVSVTSDQRIKKDIRDASDDVSLQKIRAIKPSYYSYIDTETRGTHEVVGFIAQEVAEVIPYATKKITGTVPDVYKFGTVNEDNVVFLDDAQQHGLKVGAKVKIVLDDKSSKDLTVVSIPTPSSFVVDGLYEEGKSDRVFVYGSEVDDFHVLDKNAIFTVGISAIQEVDRQLQNTKTELQNVKTELAELIQTLKNKGVIPA